MSGTCVHSIISSEICLFFWKCMPWKIVNKPILPTFDHDVCVGNDDSLMVGVEGNTIDLLQITTSQVQCKEACATVLCGNVSSVKDNACECAQTLLLTLSDHLFCDKAPGANCKVHAIQNGVFQCETKHKLQSRFCHFASHLPDKCSDNTVEGNALIFKMIYYDMENDIMILSAIVSLVLFFISFFILFCYQKRHQFTWKLNSQTWFRL